MLLDALTRCVSVLSESSSTSDTATAVSAHIVRCFSVAAQFPACRDKMVELPQLVRDLARILYFNVRFQSPTGRGTGGEFPSSICNPA